MKKNILVVGCGHWGKNLVRNFAELGSLYAVCDPNVQLANNFSQKYDVLNLSFEEALIDKNIEGVVLAIPAPLHASFAIASMEAGKHTYVEKPLAMNKDEAEQMIVSSIKSNVHLMVGHLLQYHPVFVRLKELVSSGELGKLQYTYSNRLSFGKVRSEEDVLWSFAPHDISMILALTKQNIISVKMESKSIIQDQIADNSIIHLDFDSGFKAHIHTSWIHPYKEQKLVVIGEKGLMVFDDTKVWEQKLGFYPHAIDRSTHSPNINQVELTYIDVKESEPLRNECLHFIDVVNNNSAPLTNGDEGLKVLNVLSAASASELSNEIFNMNDL